jgi:hypothetical protein
LTLKTKPYSIILLLLGIFSFLLNVSESLFNSGLNRYISAFRYDASFMHQILQFFASLVFLLVPIMCIVLAIGSFSKSQKLKLGLVIIIIINIFGELFQLFADLLNPYYEITIAEIFRGWFKYTLIGLPSVSNGIFYNTWLLVSGIISKITLFILLIVVLNSKLNKEISNPYLQKLPLSGQEAIVNKFGLEDLEKLASLLDKGLISEQEFKLKRQQILDL